MVRFLESSRALLDAATQSALDSSTEADDESLNITEGDDGDRSNSKRTVALAIISALLIVALVFYGCFRMCTSGSVITRAANFLKGHKSSSRAEGSYMSYTSNDGLNFKDAPLPNPNRVHAVRQPALPTLPED